MKLTILTLFPEYFESPFATSILKRALQFDALELNIVNIRDFAKDKHKQTDDRPFGGGPGMVMKVEPIDLALKSLQKQDNSKVILTSAKGELFTQRTAESYAKLDELIIICGHYEGVDERVAQNLVDAEVRVGDYVLTGGEPAAAVMSDAVARLLPGVLGNSKSNQDESHSESGQLGFPQYTQPREYMGWKVPELLLEGNHEKIAKWRADQKSDIKS